MKNYLYLVRGQDRGREGRRDRHHTHPQAQRGQDGADLEQTLSKAEILERYLNLVAFGPSQYGAEAASQWFFGTSADKLTLAQAALLAGMVNNPPKYNPLDENHVQDARDRRDLVLDVMVAPAGCPRRPPRRPRSRTSGLNPNRTRNGCIPADNSADQRFLLPVRAGLPGQRRASTPRPSPRQRLDDQDDAGSRR